MNPSRQAGGERAELTSSMTIVRAIAFGVGAAGRDAGRFLARLGIARESLEDVEARVPLALTIRAWALAEDETGDAAFGLHLAERLPHGAFDLLEYGMRSAATYGAALAHMARHYRLLEDGASIGVEVDGARARVVHRWAEPALVPPRQGVEALVASWSLRARRLCQGELPLQEVFFRHPAPSDIREHRRIFGASLRFGSETSGLVFERSWLDAAQSTSDEGLHRLLGRQAEALLARLPVQGELRARAERALIPLLPVGEPTLRTLAKRLGTSERTLQRALAAEGTSFKDVLAELRSRLARAYLDDGRTSLSEISLALGFSEPSAFMRAFRRWTGVTPRAYRRGSAARVATTG